MMVEAGSDKTMDEVWVVFAPADVAVSRLMARNCISQEDAEKRLSAQMVASERLAHADVAVHNGGTQKETREQLEAAWKQLMKDRVEPAVRGWVEEEERALGLTADISLSHTQTSIIPTSVPHGECGNESTSREASGIDQLEIDTWQVEVRKLWRRWAALMLRLGAEESRAAEWFGRLFGSEGGGRGAGTGAGAAGGGVLAGAASAEGGRFNLQGVKAANAALEGLRRCSCYSHCKGTGHA